MREDELRERLERLEYLTESEGKLIASLKERVKSLERLISASKGDGVGDEIWKGLWYCKKCGFWFNSFESPHQYIGVGARMEDCDGKPIPFERRNPTTWKAKWGDDEICVNNVIN